MTYYRSLYFHFRTEVCCGIIFKGKNGEVLLDMSLMNPCRCRAPALVSAPTTAENSSEESIDCDLPHQELVLPPLPPQKDEIFSLVGPPDDDDYDSRSSTQSEASTTSLDSQIPDSYSTQDTILDLSMPSSRSNPTALNMVHIPQPVCIH